MMETVMPRGAGRPRVNADPQQVRSLRDAGLSWRTIARQLHVGTVTAMRLYSAQRRGEEASQNSHQEAGA
jgi:hypothetical protein